MSNTTRKIPERIISNPNKQYLKKPSFRNTLINDIRAYYEILEDFGFVSNRLVSKSNIGSDKVPHPNRDITFSSYREMKYSW